MSELTQVVRRYADAHADRAGMARMPLQGLTAMRAYAPTGLVKSIYKPLVCLVLQGAKQLTAADETHEFAAGRTAIVTAHLPIVSRITLASRTEPYLALAIELDVATLRDLESQVRTLDGGKRSVSMATVSVEDTDPVIADCALRLVRLLERPEAIPILQPSIARELHYWLLRGRHGAAIHRLAGPGGVAHRIAQAVAVLRLEFDRPLRIEKLAAIAGMSPSTFHQNFSAVTSLSPIQFQKQLRLIEARRRLLGENHPANRVALAVGYESVTQFTREYARMFGLPPGRDREESRSA